MTHVRAHAGSKIRIYGWSILQFRLGAAMDQQYEDEKQHTETMRYIDPVIRRAAPHDGDQNFNANGRWAVKA